MRADPNRPPDEPGTQVVRIGGEGDTVPAWYRVRPWAGPLVSFTTRVLLDDADRAAIAAGGEIELTLFGGEVPWSIGVTP
jgi:hypothetical protein